MEQILTVLGILIFGSVALRLLMWALKSIYEVAPFIVIIAGALIALWMASPIETKKEMERTYADYIESIEAESGRNRNTE